MYIFCPFWYISTRFVYPNQISCVRISSTSLSSMPRYRMVTRGAVYDHNREKLLVASSGLEEVITIRMVRCLQMLSGGPCRPPCLYKGRWPSLLDSLSWMACPGLHFWHGKFWAYANRQFWFRCWCQAWKAANYGAARQAAFWWLEYGPILWLVEGVCSRADSAAPPVSMRWQMGLRYGLRVMHK